MQYKNIQNWQPFQGYSFCILQYFATKLCRFAVQMFRCKFRMDKNYKKHFHDSAFKNA